MAQATPRHGKCIAPVRLHSRGRVFIMRATKPTPNRQAGAKPKKNGDSNQVDPAWTCRASWRLETGRYSAAFSGSQPYARRAPGPEGALHSHDSSQTNLTQT